MDIGGKDLYYPGGTRSQWEAAQTYFKKLWPDHRVEVMDDHVMADEELFIYESQEVWDRLDEEGVVGDLEQRYAEFLWNNGDELVAQSFTVVVGAEFDSTELEKVIEAV